MANVYIERELGDHIRLYNGTGASIAQYDLVVLSGFVAVADEAVANTAIGSFYVKEGAVLQSTSLHATENTFATNGQAVYLTPAGTLSDTSTAGYKLVGNLVAGGTKDANGVIQFAKVGRAITI